MATDEIDPLPAPALDEAVPDRQIHETRTLDPVVIALGTDLADLEVRQGDALDRVFEIAAVVEVDSVASLAPGFQMADAQARTPRKLPGIASTHEDRRIRRIQCGDRELRDTDDVVTTRIFPRRDLERIALGELRERNAEFFGGMHREIGRRGEGVEQKEGKNNALHRIRGGRPYLSRKPVH